MVQQEGFRVSHRQVSWLPASLTVPIRLRTPAELMRCGLQPRWAGDRGDRRGCAEVAQGRMSALPSTDSAPSRQLTPSLNGPFF